MKLRTKFGVILLVVTLVLSVGVYGGLEAYKGQLITQAQSDVDETAELTASQVDATIDQRKDYLGYVASRPQATEFADSDEYLQGIVRNSRFFAAQLVDENGTIVNLHGDLTQDVRQEAIGADIRDRAYVRQALGGRIYVSDAEYVNATDSYLVIFGAPIFEDGEITGVLAASIYIDRQTFFPGLVPLETSTQAVSVRAGDRVLYSAGSQFANPVTGRSTVEETGWTVTISRDRSSLLRQLRGLAVAQAAGLLVVLLSVVGFGVWEYRRTFEQTERLLDAFRDLGAGDFDRRLTLGAGEEWAQISAGFNDLADGLAAREADLRRHEQRLEVLNRVLRHNIRNLTMIMLGYAEIVEDRSSDPEVRQAAGSIMETGIELTRLGDQARKIQATIGSRKVERVAIDISTAVETVVAAVSDEYPAITFRMAFSGNSRVSVLPTIEEAIHNLVENACEHNTDEDPWVEIEADSDPGSVRVTIEDNGPGIPEDERAVLFEEGVETQLDHSSGLGLWLAYWTVVRSGGGMTIDTNEHGGTVVELVLQSADAGNGGDGPDRSGDDE